MSNIASTTDDGSTSSFFFPDSRTALVFFNNDLTVSTLPSDEGYTTDEVEDDGDDDDESTDESTIPSSYLTTFPVETPRLLCGCKDDSTASPSTRSSSTFDNEIYNTDPTSEDTASQSPTRTIRCSSIESDNSNSSCATDNASPPMSLPEGIIRDYNRPFKSSHTEVRAESRYQVFATEPDPCLPGYYVHQLDWNRPVNTRELAKRSEQHSREIKKLGWDTSNPFLSSHVTGSEEYKADLAEWRALRQKHIDHKPTDRQRAHGRQLLSSIAQIQEKRNRFMRKGVR